MIGLFGEMRTWWITFDTSSTIQSVQVSSRIGGIVRASDQMCSASRSYSAQPKGCGYAIAWLERTSAASAPVCSTSRIYSAQPKGCGYATPQRL